MDGMSVLRMASLSAGPPASSSSTVAGVRSTSLAASAAPAAPAPTTT
jgi:hypothetical protein